MSHHCPDLHMSLHHVDGHMLLRLHTSSLRPASLKVVDENIQLLLIRVHPAELISYVMSISHMAVAPGKQLASTSVGAAKLEPLPTPTCTTDQNRLTTAALIRARHHA